jgi:hypothetical protein
MLESMLRRGEGVILGEQLGKEKICTLERVLSFSHTVPEYHLPTILWIHIYILLPPALHHRYSRSSSLHPFGAVTGLHLATPALLNCTA